MSDGLTLVAAFGIGIAASAVGATVGGGSLLSIPVLIFLGLPPQVAIATDRFAGLGGAVTAGTRFWRAGKIVWRFVPALALASLAGSLVGASALLRVDPEPLRRVVGALVLLPLPALLFAREVGVCPRDPSRASFTVGLALYFAIQVLAGFFGAGTGIPIFWILMVFFGVTMVEVAATQVVPFLVLTLSSLLLFAAHGAIDYRLGLALLGGKAVGGYLGAHLALQAGDLWVRRLFALAVLAAGARLRLA